MKSPDAFRTISEVSALLETPAHVLRFWESKFPQIKPVKRAGGRRYYRPGDIALLAGIKVLLHDQGVAIRGVQKLLREQGARYVAGLSPTGWDGAEGLEAALDEEAWTGNGEAGDEAAEPAGAEAWEAEGTAAIAAPVPPPPLPSAPPSGPAPAEADGTFVAGVIRRALDGAQTAEEDDPGPGDGADRQAAGAGETLGEVAGQGAGEVSAARVLRLLAAADPARLRANAARIAPLVERLRALKARQALEAPGAPGAPAPDRVPLPPARESL